MALTGSPQVLQGGAHTAVKFRQFMRSVLGGQAGVDAPNACLVKQRVSTGQGVLVSLGGLWLAGTSAPSQAFYYDYNDADLDVPAPAAPVSNPRIDRLVYRVYDPGYVGGTNIVGDFEWVQGAEAASPVAPALPADSESFARCARTVGNNNLVNANLTDERPRGGNWASPRVPWYNVVDYGATGDGTTDDVGAINAAILAASAQGGGRVVLPHPVGGSYAVASSINLKSNVSVEGVGANFGDITSQGVIIAAASNAFDVFVLPTGVLTTSGIALRDLCIKYGLNGVKTLDFASYVTLERVYFTGQANAGIYVEGGIEEWSLHDVKFNGQGNYGWQHVNAYMVGSGNTKAYMDKCSFYDVLCTGQGKSGWHIECLTSNNVTWYSPTINFNNQHGFYADTLAEAWTFINVNTETNGQSGKTAVTTGTIASGTNTLTVASGTGFVNGDPITVKGAGSSKDLQTTISSGGGTTALVLAANASTSVTSVEVTNRSYDDFSFNNSIGTPGGITWIGGNFGVGNYCRYAVKGDFVDTVTLIGVGVGRPVYVLDQLTMMGGNTAVRQVNDISQSTLRTTIFPGPHTASEMPWAMMSSPPGKSLILANRDSTDDGNGTYGLVEFRERSFGGFRYAYFDPAAWGFVQEYSNGYARFNGKVNFVNKMYPSTPAAASQTACSVYAGSGAPSNSDGANGDVYMRSDGGVLTTMYQKRAGAWVGVV